MFHMENPQLLIYYIYMVGGFHPYDKYESQSGLLFPTEWKKIMFQTTNHIYIYIIICIIIIYNYNIIIIYMYILYIIYTYSERERDGKTHGLTVLVATTSA